MSSLVTQAVVDQDPGLTGNLLVERLVGAHVELISKEEYGKIGSVVCSLLLFASHVLLMHDMLYWTYCMHRIAEADGFHCLPLLYCYPSNINC